MHNESSASRASGSRGGSHTPSETKKENNVNDCPSNYRCDPRGCNSTSSRISDLSHREESIHSTKQQCPYVQCGYETRRRDNTKEQMRKLHGLPNPDSQNRGISTDSQYHHTYGTQRQDIFNSADNVDTDDLPNVDGTESYEESSCSQIQLSYSTYASCDSSVDLADSANAMVPYANTTTYLNGIGQWVDDHSSSAFAWTAWQNPDTLLQHASRCRVTSNMLKPHVEEAMNCFQASFYGVGGATSEYLVVEHW